MKSTALRFLLGGAFNTTVTFALYWGLMRVVDYQLAYAASYAIGIILGYAVNTKLVFRVARSWRGAALYPLVYLAGYLAGAVVLGLAVEVLGVPKWLAPVVSVCVVLPLTFLLTRLVLQPAKPR